MKLKDKIYVIELTEDDTLVLEALLTQKLTDLKADYARGGGQCLKRHIDKCAGFLTVLRQVLEQ